MAFEDWYPNIIPTSDGTYSVYARVISDTPWAGKWGPAQRVEAAQILKWVREQRIYPLRQYDKTIGKTVYIAIVFPLMAMPFWHLQFRTLSEALAFKLRWG